MTEHVYLAWWDAGFGSSLISITPPDGAISPHGALQPGSMGKAPGILRQDGWVGYPWRKIPMTREALERVLADGGGVGLKTDFFPAIDIDVLDPDLADFLARVTEDELGVAPARYGQPPKRILLYRTEEPSAKRKLTWTIPGLDKPQAVEILGAGNQCVVAGIHPKTRAPYLWPDGSPVLLGPEGLTLVTSAQLDGLVARLTASLAGRGFVVEESRAVLPSDTSVAQEGLAGALELVRAAVEAIPPTDSREEWCNIGMAIKAALPENPVEAYELWCQWSDKWAGGNTEEMLETTWRSFRPPFRRGATWLYELAAQQGESAPLAAKFIFEDAPAVSEKTTIVSDTSVLVFGSEAWLAERFLAAHGEELRYVPEFQEWVRWDGHRWVEDPNLVAHLAAQCCQAAAPVLRNGASTPTEAKSLTRSASANRTRHSVLDLAKDHPAITVRADRFDAVPYLLNTPGGIVDLRTGEITPSDPMRLMMRATTVAPSFEAPERFLRFLEEMTGGDKELEAYLQRWFGYGLTGYTAEEKMTFFWGSGGNGKSTLLEAMMGVMGSYATTAPSDTFLSSHGDRQTNDIARLPGARLVVAQETREGRVWDTGTIKQLTGSDRIIARLLFKEFFEFTPQFKLVFASNHQPRMESPDEAMVRRFQMVPFNLKPKVVDPQLKIALVKEYPQILGWMIQGCLAWQRIGLAAPAAVTVTTADYLEESDVVGNWIQQRCEVGRQDIVTSLQDLHNDFDRWCAREHQPHLQIRAFSAELKRKGFAYSKQPVTKRAVFRAIALAPITGLDSLEAMLGSVEVAPSASTTLH